MAEAPEQRGRSERDPKADRGGGKRPAAGDSGSAEMLRLIVEEVDGARDILQLVRQLEPALPIRSFKDLRRLTKDGGAIQFRSVEIDLDFYEGFMPDYAFPIEDLRGLVARVAQLIRMLPPDLGKDPNDPENMRRMMKQSPTFGPALVNPVTRGAMIGVPAPSAPGARSVPNPEKPC